MWTIKKTFQQRHPSTWEISLPFLFIWHDLICIYFMFLYVLTCISFIRCFFICFGPNLWNLKEMFVYLNQIAFFSLFTFPYCLSLSLLYVLYLRQDWTPLVKSKPAHFFSKHTQTHTHAHTQTHTYTHSRLFLLSDACAWNFLHCFVLPCSFPTWHELHWN